MECLKELTICIAGATSEIAYSFIPMLLGGSIFGNTVKINLRLLDDLFQQDRLKSLCMDIEDSLYLLMNKLVYGADPKEMFKEADVIIFAQNNEQSYFIDSIQKYKELAIVLNENGKSDCKIIIANQVNPLAYILQKFA